MSKVLPGLSIPPSFEPSYASRSHYVPQESSTLLDNFESRLPERSSGRYLPDTTSSMADPPRRSIYDMPSARISDEYQRRQSLGQRTSREQLPPLSSIFQTSHTTTLPVRTPYAERSPSFAAVSPRTNLQTITSVREDHHHQEPSYELRNYAQAGPPSSYPFGGRSDRASIPHPSRTLSTGSLSGVGPQPLDPRYGPNDSSRLQSSPGLRWSPRASESSSSDYFPRMPQDLRHQLPQAPPVMRYQDPYMKPDQKLPYGESRFHTSPQLAQYQLSSNGTNYSEPSSTKDILGPKIWTGTQFLPRFVKQLEVPGEGLCYFYDDGSHCKTVIDGEIVNAHWGVTKAGKPRKRLAIACITCREKKIKCDPDYPKCIQCEKFGRVCKFKNAPRGTGHGSPETTSPAETDEFLDHDSNFAVSQRADADKDDTESNHSKRRKNTSNAFTPVKAENEALFGTTDGYRHLSSASENSLYFDSLLSTWHTDPYESNATLSNHLIEAFFTHINSGYYRMFPEQQFLKWIRNSSKKKSLDSHMLVYAMLALGTVFSGKMEHKERGREFAKIGRYAADNRPFSLQLVQTRLLLSLYFTATGDKDASWDLCGGAMRAATALRLNLDNDDLEDITRIEAFPYDLSRQGYSECKRRTFWSLYIMDRFNGFCFGYTCMLNPEDVFLRLPCEARSFEAQLENTNPYFDVSAPSITSAQTGNLGSMAYLVVISSIWGDVMSNITRTSNRPSELPPVSKTAYTNFHNATTNRLEDWEASLPSSMQYSTVNLERSMHEGFFSTFVTMHSLYHTTQIKLNRFHRPTDVSVSQLERNIRKAYTSAQNILAIADTLAASTTVSSQRLTKTIEMAAIKPEFSNPFVGYALVSAIDLISAKGRRNEIPKLLQTLDGAKTVINRLEMFWHSARTASRLLNKRIEDLEELIGWDGDGRRPSEGAISEAGGSAMTGIWEMEESIERTFAKGIDGVYKAPLGIWISATEGCKTEC